MAELVGLIGGLIGVVGAGTKLTIAIFDFAGSIGGAGKELQDLATDISLLCNVLKQLHELLDHAKFRPSASARKDALKIADQCERLFNEINDIVSGLRSEKGDAQIPSLEFTKKVKWVFSEKKKVLVLRSTLNSCKLTLVVMLNIMHLAERSATEVTNLEEDERNKAMTQSLVISQQCAVEQLEHREDELEKEEDLAMQLPGSNTIDDQVIQKRRKSRERPARMFSGLSLVTDLPTPTAIPPQPPTRAERASVWLDNILAVAGGPVDLHPGAARQRRTSSVGTANAPQQLLQKWTDQADKLGHTLSPQSSTRAQQVEVGWHGSKFSFTGSEPPPTISEKDVARIADESPVARISRVPTDLVSPTAQVQAMGLHAVLNVDGALESSRKTVTSNKASDSYDSIVQAILQEHGASSSANETILCISYGGKTKILKPSDKPLQELKRFDELDLDPRFCIRKIQAQLRSDIAVRNTKMTSITRPQLHDITEHVSR